jgi:hypothetical protein
MVKYNKDEKTLTLSRNTFLNISVGILIMLGGALVTATISFQNLRNQVSQNTITAQKNNDNILRLQTDGTSAKIELTKIQTQLSSIESTLIELKEGLTR